MKTTIANIWRLFVTVNLILPSAIFAARQDENDHCDLQLWLHRPQQWHDVMEGFTYGFYRNPPVSVDECVLCDWVGKSGADTQSIIVDLEFVRGLWVTMDYFDELGGWEIVPPVVQSSRPPTVQYRFITWRDTAIWTFEQGKDAHYTLTEYGKEWAKDTHQDLSEFGTKVIDGFGEFSDSITDGVDIASWHLKKNAQEFSNNAKESFQAMERCWDNRDSCTAYHLERINEFMNSPFVREIYEYHMDKIDKLANDVGLGVYFQKIKFFADLIFMFWGLGYTLDKILSSKEFIGVIDNILLKLDSDYILEFTNNIHEDWLVASILLMTIPGKSCESIGTRIGIVTRKITGVAIEGVKSAQDVARDFNDFSKKEDEEFNQWDNDVCSQFCKRIPWYPDYVVEDTCPTRCMDANPDWRKEYV